MTRKLIQTSLWLLAGILVLSACTEDYDPIGNNKPATKLKMSPKYLAFDGAGGDAQATIETNAPELEVGNVPDWVADVSFNEIGRAHVCTPVTNALLVCRLLLEKNKLVL